MHREVPLLHSRVRQLARGLSLLTAHPGRFSTFLLSFALAATVSASSVTYTYDELGRLKLTTYDNGSSTTYTLDAAGNRKLVAMVPPTPVQAPATVTATVASATSLNVSWHAATGGTGSYTYSVFASPSGTLIVSGVTGTSTLVSGLSPFTSYSFTVNATDTDGTSSPQSAASPATETYALPVFNSFGGTANSSTAITLSWSASDVNAPGISGYTLTRTPGGLNVSPLSTATSYPDSGLTPNTSYTYTLTANDGHGDTASASATVKSLPLPSIANFTAIPASSTTMTLSWTGTDAPPQGAITYTLMRGSTPLGTVTSPFTDTGPLAPNTGYTYTLTATDALLEVGSSSTSGTTYPLPTVSLIASQATAHTMTLTFSGSDAPAQGALTYGVIRNPSTPLSNVSPATDSGLSPGTTYSYTVTVTDAVGDTNTATASNTTYPLPTASLSVESVTSNSITLDYSSLDLNGPTPPPPHGAGTPVSVSIYEAGQPLPILGNSPNTGAATFVVTGLSPSTYYAFTLYSTDAVGDVSLGSSASATTAAVSTPSIPGTPTPSGIVTSTPWLVQWAASTGPVAYYILNRNNSGTSTNYTVTAPTTSSSQAGTNGLTYIYQVQACTSAGACSSFSPQTEVTYCRNGTCP
jgi:YD repeat-containing protein